MNWKEKLSEIEKDFGFHKEINWQQSVDFVNELLSEYPKNVELYIRAIYLLHNILVEEEYHNVDENRMVELLQKWFSESKEKFLENSEYLFFIGKILHISEWFFGMEDSCLALEFQKKAMVKEPENKLYEWAYRLSCGDIIEMYLAHQLVNIDNLKINWLKTKGFPGEYIIEQLKMSNEEYLDKL